MNHTARRILSALALTTLASVSCGGTTTTAYSYYDPYAYYGYYPSDVYYSGYYWTDPYSVYYYEAIGAASGTVGPFDGGTADGGAGGPGLLTVGDVIRNLAKGVDVCPNQVTITNHTAPDVCPTAGSATLVRNGVNLVFNGCALSDGGRIDGTFDVQGTRTASDVVCTSTTTITVALQTTITNLTYTGPGGRKVVIPNESGTSSFSFMIGQAPTLAALDTSGRMQVVAKGGSTIIDQTFTGNATVTPGANKSSYALDGTVTLQDQLTSGSTTLTLTGLSRGGDCCRPTAGTLKLDRSGGVNPGIHTWTFGPACGAATFDKSAVNLTVPCF